MRIMLKEDAQAAFDGDPAATSIQETILTYPGICALTMHRISHFLYTKKVPLIPRMFSEIIHNQTGIDIHPGAIYWPIIIHRPRNRRCNWGDNYYWEPCKNVSRCNSWCVKFS